MFYKTYLFVFIILLLSNCTSDNLNNNKINIIPENKFYHITHLIEDAKNQGKKIGVFPVDEDDWIDIGQWAEYQKAIDKF